ncbi:MAG: hypothetical protein HOI91_14960 [Halieaceae bacterium]|jgi:hypothetical protein|nr:hypothetical protein [Halieaceae bacterium]
MMKINSIVALIFSLALALALAPAANAQFGKLLGGDKDEDKEEGTSSSSPFGALLGGGEEEEEEEPAYVLVTAAEWLARSQEEQATYIAEIREIYPQDPPIGSPEAAELAAKQEKEEGGLGFLKSVNSVLEGGSEVDEAELVRGFDDEKLKIYLALGPQDRVKFALTNDQELMVTLFKDSLMEVTQGQGKLLRAFNLNDEAAALEASAALIAGECDNACVEGVIEQSVVATASIEKLSSDSAEMSDDGKAQYNGAMGDLGAGTVNLVLLIPVAAEWGPRALNTVAEVATSGMGNALNAGLASASAEMAAEGQSEEEQAASTAEREALAKEAEAAGEAMAGNIEELLAPGLMVVTKGPPLLKDYVTLFYDLITYGEEKELDTSGIEDFEFDDF